MMRPIDAIDTTGERDSRGTTSNGTTTTNNVSTPSTRTTVVSIPFGATADVCDAHPKTNECRVPPIEWRSYGRATQFSGMAVTLDLRDCPNDNRLVRETLVSTSGFGKVLVVGANGSRQCALLGDNLGNAAVTNGWCGIVLHGCVRDSTALAQLPLGIVAVGTTPQRSPRKGGPGKFDVRVDIGGVPCYPGDQVFCDSDGVVFLNPPNVFRT